MTSILEPNQVEDIINTASTIRDKALLSVIYQCGLRRQEVSLLSLSDYNRETHLLTVHRIKHKVVHLIVLWQQSYTLLEQYLDSRKDDSEALFLGRKGNKALGSNGVYYLYRDLARKIGLPDHLHHPHCLRHSIGSHLIRAGMDIVTVQSLLGHSRVSGTVYYTQASISKPIYDLSFLEKSEHFPHFLSQSNTPTYLIKITGNKENGEKIDKNIKITDYREGLRIWNKAISSAKQMKASCFLSFIVKNLEKEIMLLEEKT